MQTINQEGNETIRGNGMKIPYSQYVKQNLHLLMHPPVKGLWDRIKDPGKVFFILLYEIIRLTCLIIIWLLIFITAPISIPLIAWNDYLKQRKLE